MYTLVFKPLNNHGWLNKISKRFLCAVLYTVHTTLILGYIATQEKSSNVNQIHESVLPRVFLNKVIGTVKPIQPTTSTDRPLPYIYRFISVPNDCSYIYSNSLNRLNGPHKFGLMVGRFKEVLLHMYFARSRWTYSRNGVLTCLIVCG